MRKVQTKQTSLIKKKIHYPVKPASPPHVLDYPPFLKAFPLPAEAYEPVPHLIRPAAAPPDSGSPLLVQVPAKHLSIKLDRELSRNESKYQNSVTIVALAKCNKKNIIKMC